MNKINIIDMQVKDINRVYELGKEVSEFEGIEGIEGIEGGNRFWPKNILENWVKSPQDISLVAEQKNQIVGFSLVAYHPISRKATFENLYVSSDFISNNYQRGVITIKLYKESEKKLKEFNVNSVCAFSEIENEAIIKLMKGQGFEKGKAYYWMEKGFK